VPELYAKILNDPAPSVRSLVPSVPAAVDALVARCLEKDRSARFADATELARAILALPRDRSAFVDTLPAGARTLAEARRGRAWAVRLGAAAALAVATVAGIAAYRGESAPPSPAPPSTVTGATASNSAAPSESLTEPSGKAPETTVAPADQAKPDAGVAREGGPATAKPGAPRRVNDLKQIKLIE
jgi:serine/threonine-protein kinase